MDDVSTSDRPMLRFVPEYGPIEATIGYGFFYVLIDVGTPVVRDAVAGADIGIDPAVVPWVAAIALWAILFLSVLGQAVEQLRDNPRRFEDRASARSFYEAITPTTARMQVWALLVGVGGVIVILGASAFFESFRTLLAGMVVVVDSAFTEAVPVGEFAWFVVYTIAFSLFSRYTDRLLLGYHRRRVLEDLRGTSAEHRDRPQNAGRRT